MPAPAALEFHDVTFAYSRIPVLEAVCFRIDPGETVAVIGPNGSGKTTLVRLALGLLAPQRGTIEVLGTTPVRARTRVGYVPQALAFDPQFPITAAEVLATGLPPRVPRNALRPLLEALDLGSLAPRRFSQLSGGQRQRVLIGRALAAKPELLLLDEPTAHADPGAQARLRRLLREIDPQMTLLTVSHDAAFVAGAQGSKILCVNRQVYEHTTATLTPAVMEKLYGEPVRLVDHHSGHHSHE